MSKPVVLYRGTNPIYKLIEAILEEYEHCKQKIKKHFNKNFIISVKDEEKFQLSNKRWICNKLFTEEDKKVRDHDHITKKHIKSSAHSSCNINLKSTKKVPVIFRRSKSYDGHLTMQKNNKFDAEINVIPNGLEKYTVSTTNKNLIFTESIQFINSSLDELVKNLTNNVFKYLSQE